MSPPDESETAQSTLSRSENAGLTYGPPHTHRVDHAESNPEIVARLEWLDDLMFAAIEGNADAFETAVDAWRKTLDELGHDALEESRVQYLRRAQSVWNDLRREPNHPPHKVFAAIEMISLLAGRAW